jgi:tRNA G18 (ribose-2'-O)-methylase SpoU
MLMERITDSSDPRINVYRNLKDKDLRRDNAFIVEGKFILDVLLKRSNFKISSVLITDDRLLPLETVLKHLPEEIPLYVTAPEVMEQITGFDVHRGVLAAGIAQQHQVSLPTYLNAKSKVAILSNIANPDNIGAIFRNAAGLGIEAVILDAQCCNPLYRKAIRVSMGATLVLPWVQTNTIDQIIPQLKAADFSVYALSLQSTTSIENVRFEPRSAFLFGEEAHGLPPHIQDQCHAVTIPMANNTDSLNVAASSAIVFDAVRRGRA